MKKADIILAKKAISARQVKNEHKIIRETLELQRSARSGSRSTPDLRSSWNGESFERKPSTPSLPSINETNSFGSYSPSRTDTLLRSPKDGRRSRGEYDQTLSASSSYPELSDAGNDMVKELSQRATTAKTGLRKMQTQVIKAVKEKELRKRASTAASNQRLSSRGSEAVNSPGQGSRGSSSARLGTASSSGRPGRTTTVDYDIFQGHPTINLDSVDNMFMPKRDIPRSDGATLSEIYASKKADSWGKILKAQLREEEERKIRERREREEANELYGRRIKEQVAERERRKAAALSENNEFAALEDATAKRTEDLQKRRTQEAIDRHRQFISNAVEDIGVKRQQREKQLYEELTASTMMVNKAKEAIAKAEAEKEASKLYHKRYQEQVFHDNLDRLARKEKAKQDSFSEDRRVIELNELMHQQNEARKQKELADRMSRSTEGPAHAIVQKIVEAKQRNDHEFFDSLYKTENMLNTQLKHTEDAAIARNLANGQGLTDEWVKNAEYKARKRKEDEERNNQILATMRKMLADQEAEDREKRRQQVKAHHRYQRELDEQLSELRQRSYNALAKTMSEQEQLYNADLLRKTHVDLN